jgi:hypothetical protein
MAGNYEAIIPDDALKAATKAVEDWLVNYTLPANFSLGREHNEKVAEANAEAIARVALTAAANRIAEIAWDEGVIYGHNTEGRLIDKRAENPLEKKA